MLDVLLALNMLGLGFCGGWLVFQSQPPTD